MSMPDPSQLDPFRAPSSPIDLLSPAPGGLDPVALRRIGLRRERVIRSLGLVLYLLAAWLLVFCLGSVPRTIGLMTGSARFIDAEMGRRVMVRGFWFAGIGIVLGAGVIALGSGLRRLSSRARWVAVLLATVLLAWVVESVTRLGLRDIRSVLSIEQLILAGLPGVFLGTILLLLLARPAGMIFDEPYRIAVLATPELRPGPGRGAKILLGLMILVALLMLFTGVTHTATIRG